MLDVEVFSLETASILLRADNAKEEWQVLISIGDPNSAYPSGFKGIDTRLRLEFDDIDSAMLGYAFKKDTPPNKTHIKNLIDFVTPLKDMEGKCLVHCYAGVARSPAAAFIANSIWLGPGNEDLAMEKTLAGCDKNWVYPNDLMISIADDMLNRSGEMVNTLNKFVKTNVRMY